MLSFIMVSLVRFCSLSAGLTALALWTCASATAASAPTTLQAPSSTQRSLEGVFLHGDTSSPFSDAIASFYAARSDRPVWIERGKLNPSGIRLVQSVLNAHEHGIDWPDLILFAASAAAQPLSGEDIAVFDRRLTALFLRYAQAVRTGRVAPDDIGMTWAIPRPVFDEVQILDELQHGDPGELLDEQPPPHATYRSLVEALARYRQIDAAGGWPNVPGGAVLDLGQRDGRVAVLRQRLAREGYIPADGADSTLFDEPLRQAVQAFQERHGLAVDGRVGVATLAALNVSAAIRVKQIEANMERWRWMPRVLPAHRIEVNVAAQELTVFDGDPVLEMRVIVGTPRHRTPMLQSAVREVVINPPWNVPVSIAMNEIQPRLRRDPDYLRREDIRILNRPDDPYGFQIDWKNLPRGTRFRFQQQPGPLNALGRLKFEIPNRFDVYLHDTPAKALFARPTRTFSHGCIRLQHPDLLAEHLLGGPDERWTGEWTDRKTVRIPLQHPVPVYLLYWTAFVAPDGQMHFRDDVYGHDKALLIALGRQGQRQLMSQRAVGGCAPG